MIKIIEQNHTPREVYKVISERRGQFIAFYDKIKSHISANNKITLLIQKGSMDFGLDIEEQIIPVSLKGKATISLYLILRQTNNKKIEGKIICLNTQFLRQYGAPPEIVPFTENIKVLAKAILLTVAKITDLQNPRGFRM